ncbi:MAG TPA: adenosylcobinamide-GDP ribazoletransferase [Acidimicrobiales bacterium]|nr:adenosylcobinamide-GDP ribazoletransferase [Acidimicrobiales bacterium]
MSERSSGGLGSALGLLTVVGGGSEMRLAAVAWFPVVGAALGTGLGAAWWALGRVFPPLVAGGIVVAADLAVTGMLHADGLIDSADGLLPHLERARRLAVMAEPQVGAFGVTAALIVLGLRLVALGSVTPASAMKGVLLLGAIWMASRSVMGLATGHLRYARVDGMATAFVGGRPLLPALGLVAAAAALVYWHALAAPAVLGAELVGAGLVFWLAHRRLGGFTGDVLGAAGLLGETLALLVAAARW